MDSRVRYTKKVIRETFIKLLSTKDIAHVTVKEICAIAEINRATFYKYYDNAYDLMEKLEQQSIDELAERISAIDHCDMKELFRILVESIYQQKDFYAVVFSKNGDNMLKERVISMCYNDNISVIKESFPSITEHEQEWLYYFFAEGCCGILKRWWINDFAQPVEEVAGFLTSMMESVYKVMKYKAELSGV